MSAKIGLNQQSLYRKQVTENLTIKELKKCLACNDARLLIVYKGENYVII
jgi:hypothetical protein